MPLDSCTVDPLPNQDTLELFSMYVCVYVCVLQNLSTAGGAVVYCVCWCLLLAWKLPQGQRIALRPSLHQVSLSQQSVCP